MYSVNFGYEEMAFIMFVYSSCMFGLMIFDYIMSYTYLYKAMKKVCPDKAVLARIPLVRFFVEPFFIDNKMKLGKYEIGNIIAYELFLVFLVLICPIFGLFSIVIIIFVTICSIVLNVGMKYFIIKKMLPDKDEFIYTLCYVSVPFFKYVTWYLICKDIDTHIGDTTPTDSNNDRIIKESPESL